MKKSNKGFTLVELLVTIAIMMSILGIAIVSFIKISDRKKQEALELVKEQIETAAKEYFTANEYLFEGFSDGASGTISVGKLVNEDYLNVVTNPVTGKKVSKYVIVKVTKKGSSYETIVDNINAAETATEEAAADKHAQVTVMENGATTGEIAYYNTENKKINPNAAGWFNNDLIKPVENNKKLKVCIKADKTKIVKITINGTEPTETYDNTKGYCSLISEGKHNNLEYKIINSSNKVWVVKRNEYIDITNPSLNVGLYKKESSEDITSSKGLATYSNNTWYKQRAFTQATVSDSLSGINTTTYTTTGTTTNDTNKKGTYRNINAQGISTIKYKTCDVAGNCKESPIYTIKLDRTNPTLTVDLYKNNTGDSVTSSSGLSKYSNNTWYSGRVFTIPTSGDTLSGVKSTTYTTTGTTTNDTNKKGSYRNINAQGKSTIKYKTCDVAGNCIESSIYTIKLDRTKPSLSLIVVSKNSNYNTKGVNISISSDDANGNIDVSGVQTVTSTAPGSSTGATSWSNSSTSFSKEYTSDLFSALDGSNKDVTVTSTDAAGNKTIKTVNYIVYNECVNVNYQDGNNCSKECGGGTKNRLAYDEKTNVRCTSKDKATGGSACNTRSCCSKTTTTWGSWGSCSRACGSGTKTRTGTKYSDYNGSYCGTDSDSQTCNTQNCCSKTTTTWGSWGSCSKSCGGGTKTRTGTKYSDYDGSNCGSDSDSKSCNTQACTTTTENVCDNLSKYVSIKSSTHQTNGGTKTKAYSTSVSKQSDATYVEFTFTISNSNITKVETHAAFCGDLNTCKDINSSNKNQKKVICTTSTDCQSGWEYVGASIKVKCGSKTKVLNYAHKIGTSETWTGWEK